jgi:hypothetical protein
MDTLDVQRRLVVLFVAGCVLLGYPLLTVYSVPQTIGGVPVLYVVIFGIWAALIGASAAILHRTTSRDSGGA